MKNKKIIIVGAGIAGLTAAKLLDESGFDVTILEAKAWIGGRTHTLNIEGAGIDTGATWIHYRYGNPLTYIGEANGFKIIDDEDEPLGIWDEGQSRYLNDDEQEEYMDAAEEARTAAVEFYKEKRFDKKTSDFFDIYIQDKDWATDKIRIVKFIYQIYVELDYAADFEKVSLSDENHISKFDNDGEVDALIIGGYDKITQLLAKNLDIRLSMPVKKIDYTSDKIKISTSKDTFECDKVIITVSLGVLKHNGIQFLPNLPEVKQTAIQNMTYGNLEKIILTFEEAFWKDRRYTIYFGKNENGVAFPTISNFTPFTNIPTLGIYYSGTFGEQMMQLTDQEILAKVLSLLEKLFDKENLKPTHFHISRWLSDPYFYGSYSFASADNTNEHIQNLGQPIDNRVLFAGEATSLEGQAYVHGGLLSGIREAQRLGASLDGIKGLKAFFENKNPKS